MVASLRAMEMHQFVAQILHDTTKKQFKRAIFRKVLPVMKKIMLNYVQFLSGNDSILNVTKSPIISDKLTKGHRRFVS